MVFAETALPGAYVIEAELKSDERGFFARTFCKQEFQAHGLDADIAQCSLSLNQKRNTLRGLHYLAPPHEEAKVVRCVGGSMYDVIVDIRKGSGTYGKWFATELSAENARALYIPKGFAHGFLTLEDNCYVLYQMSAPYRAESDAGILYSDPAIDIEWPRDGEYIMSDRDRNLPCLR